jgi:hypothetical protein
MLLLITHMLAYGLGLYIGWAEWGGNNAKKTSADHGAKAMASDPRE